jgi:hypothetical protein
VTGTPHTCALPGDYFYVKPGGYTTDADAISAPLLTETDFTNYYNNSFIRPGDPCDNPGPNGATRLADSTFDNDSTPLNGVNGNGSAAQFNLTPTYNYTCEAKDNAGRVVGELTWNNTTKLLQIRGTIYLDGNVTISQNATYQGVNSTGVHPSGDTSGTDGIGGQAVLYISGTYSQSNVRLCGWDTTTDTAAVTGSACDFNKWTPNTSMLMIVAHGSADSFTLAGGSSCSFQGAVYALYNASFGQQCRVEGPFIATTMAVGQGVSMKPLPGVSDLPVGAPGNPNTAGVPEAPSYGAG